jgi:hypothetical protein
MMAPLPCPPAAYSPYAPTPQPTAWDQAGLQAALQNMSLQGRHGGSEFFLDTGATSHMANNPGTLHNPSRYSSSSRVIVGNGETLPITHTGDLLLPTSSSLLRLCNVIVTPNLIKNLISVRTLTRQNPVTVEFDAFGFSIKDL